MCLGKVFRKAEVKIGYKILRKKQEDGQTIYGTLFDCIVVNKPYILGEWNIAQFFNNWSNELKSEFFCDKKREKYPVGFHIITKLDDIKKYLHHLTSMDYEPYYVVEVEYYGELAYGIDGTNEEIYNAGIECVVASHMRVVKEIELTS